MKSLKQRRKGHKKDIENQSRGKYSARLNLNSVNWNKAEKLFCADRLNLTKPGAISQHSTITNRELLKLLAAGCVIALSFVVPTALVAFGSMLLDGSKYNKKRFKQSIGRLKRQKLVTITEENGITTVRITAEGRIRALRYKLDEMIIETPKKWDGKWRVMIFDIPEKEKRARELLRSFLKRLGCLSVQRSVYIHPYPCFDEIEYLRELFGVAGNVTYMVVTKIEGDKELLTHFDLMN